MLNCYFQLNFEFDGYHQLQMLVGNLTYTLIKYTQPNMKKCELKVPQQTYKSSPNRELDPRDEVLNLPFSFDVTGADLDDLSNLQIAQILVFDSQLDRVNTKNKTVQEIIKFLVTASETIFSVSFNFLQNEKLTEKEAKDYAAKNILINCLNLMGELKRIIKEFNLENKREKLERNITEIIEYTLQQNISNLASYYPQATPTGTANMRKSVKSMDQKEEAYNDFLFLNRMDLMIEDDPEDYGKDIMRVINQIIEFSTKVQDDKYGKKGQLTNFERFQKFNSNLFSLITLKNKTKDFRKDHIGKFLKKLNGLNNIEQALFPQEDDNKKGDEKKSDEKNSNDEESEDESGKDKELEDKRLNSFISLLLDESIPKFPEQFNQQVIKTKQQLKADKKYELGIKIPKHIKPYSQEQIRKSLFTVSHSSVLRILVKWAESFQDIFKNPRKYFNEKKEFKKNNFRLIQLTPQQKQHFIQAVLSKKAYLDKQLQILIEKNKELQSKFMFEATENNEIIQFINLYTAVRVLSSKMTLILSHFMFKIIKIYMKILHQIPREIVQKKQISKEERQKLSQVNLIAFNIGDLMRSKFHCKQKQFIDILKLFYHLDNREAKKSQVGYPPMFRLVKINNKLDKADNNVLINYIFLNKYQCQIQLSLDQGQKKKQKNYYIFAHFMYELSRGKFGVFSECQTIINQNDPLMNKRSEKLNYYAPTCEKIKKKEEKTAEQNKIPDKVNIIKEKIWSIFPCQKCKKIEIINNPQFYKQFSTIYCIKCSNFQKNMNQILKNVKLQDNFLSHYIISDRIQQYKNHNFNARKTAIENKNTFGLYISRHDRKPEIKIYATWFDQNSKRVYFVTNKEQKTKQFQTFFSFDETKTLEDSTLDYFIQIKKQDFLQEISEEFKFILSLTEDELKKQILSQIQFDSLLKNVKRQSTNLNWNNKSDMLVKFENKIKNSSNPTQLKSLLSNLQTIDCSSTNLQEIPSWIFDCKNVSSLSLSHNKIKSITSLKQGAGNVLRNLRFLNLEYNNLKVIEKDDFKNLSNLRQLLLGHNDISWIDASNWQFLSKLEILDLSFNRIQQITSQNLEMSQDIAIIVLNDNLLQTLAVPATLLRLQLISFQNNQNLKKLTIPSYGGRNKIIISELKQLTKITISAGNIIKEIQKHLENLIIQGKISGKKLKLIKICNNDKLQDFQVEEPPVETNLHIQKCQMLTRIQIQPQNIIILLLNQLGIPQLLLQNYPHLESLTISENQHLSQITLKHFPKLSALHICGNISLETILTQTISIPKDLSIKGNPQLKIWPNDLKCDDKERNQQDA